MRKNYVTLVYLPQDEENANYLSEILEEKHVEVHAFEKRRNYMKAHKYWSVVALITMIGTFYTGYKGLKAAHKYFAFGSLICMTMAVYSGHKMISGNKRTRKQVENTKAEE